MTYCIDEGKVCLYKRDANFVECVKCGRIKAILQTSQTESGWHILY